MAEQADKNTIHINRYSSRRLYNTATSDYVTLDDIAKLIREGNDIKVTDKKTGEDLTRQVLLQIISDHESKGDNVLPLSVLTDLVRSYNETSQSFVPDFLAESFDLLKKQQAEIMGSLSNVPNPFDPSAAIEGMDNWRKSQTEMLENMMKPWIPGAAGPVRETEGKPSPEKTEGELDRSDVESELQQMKKQIEMLQDKLKDI